MVYAWKAIEEMKWGRSMEPAAVAGGQVVELR